MSSEASEAAPRRGSVIRKREFAGKGAGIQLLGLASPFIGGLLLGAIGAVLGMVALVVLLIVGSMQSSVWLCSECRNKVRDRTVRVCPACHAELH